MVKKEESRVFIGKNTFSQKGDYYRMCSVFVLPAARPIYTPLLHTTYNHTGVPGSRYVKKTGNI